MGSACRRHVATAGGHPALAVLIATAAVALGPACIYVPPPDTSPVAVIALPPLPRPGAQVVIEAIDDADVHATERRYLRRACVVGTADRNTAFPGYLRALLTCDGEEVLFSAVRLREITKLARDRRLPAGLTVIIAGLGVGDVYYDERARFTGTPCLTVDVRRSFDQFYQGTLACAGVRYHFAYVALGAADP